MIVITALFLKGMCLEPSRLLEAAETSKASKAAKRERESMMEQEILTVAKKGTPKIELSEPQIEVREELLRLQRELLQFPKKDRLRFGGDFDMTYDTNPNRIRIHNEEGDTFFNLNPSVQLNLSGQKTDLRLEYRPPRLYNVKRSKNPGNDTFNQELTLRASRKILPRTLFSINERLSRQSITQAGKDNKKITWNQTHRSSLNYELSKKFSIALDGSHTRTDFPNEDYDEGYTRQFTLNPSIFFQITPKTKLSANYGFTYSRAQVKTSDIQNHEFRFGYTGRITGKSTLSTDIGYSHQSPDAAEAAKDDKLVYSLGYIWQATPKTSMRFLYSSSYTFSMTDAIATSGPFPFTKTRTYSVSDSLSFSTRWKAHSRINLEFSFDLSHSRSKSHVSEGVLSVTKSRQWTFPFQTALDFQLARWCRMRLTYTYRHRVSDEKDADENRAHTWFLASNLSF